MKIARSKVHFVGIGGIGMSGLAELLHNMGATVSGSDQAENANTQRLASLGIKIYKGHAGKNISNPDVVVFSSAVKKDNPEILEAQKEKIPIIPRAEVLAEVMRLRRGVAVGGTHGKTTTTSMVASIFIHGKLDPTVVVGGRLDLIKSNSLLGQGEWLVAEADESDGSFVNLSPEIAIVTNIDNDHMDYFKNISNLQKAFVEFAFRIPFYGLVVVCGDDPETKKLFNQFNKRVLFYGFNSENDFVLRGARSQYEVLKDGKILGSFDLNLPGRHNALNALAAIITGMEAGLTFETCAQGLRLFLGVDRRFHWKGEAQGVQVYDDYGHHPTEVKSVLEAFREKYPENRIVVMFQPHRFSRTKVCWREFTESFTNADLVFVTDIYSAGEAPIESVTGEKLASELKTKNSKYIGAWNKSKEKILKELKAGDVFVTLGAGDVWKAGMDVLSSYGKN